MHNLCAATLSTCESSSRPTSGEQPCLHATARTCCSTCSQSHAHGTQFLPGKQLAKVKVHRAPENGLLPLDGAGRLHGAPDHLQV